MKTYYIHNGNQESGPFSLQELSGRLERHTPVWKPGLPNWTPANQLPELKDIVTPETFGCKVNSEGHPLQIKQEVKPIGVSRFLPFGTLLLIIMALIMMVYP